MPSTYAYHHSNLNELIGLSFQEVAHAWLSSDAEANTWALDGVQSLGYDYAPYSIELELDDASIIEFVTERVPDRYSRARLLDILNHD